MANSFYTPYLNALLNGDIDHATMDLFVDALDVGYTFDPAHDGRDDVLGVGSANLVASVTVPAASVSINGAVIDIPDFAYTSVSGDDIRSIVVSVETGESDAQRIPVVFFDTSASGAIEIEPNGEDINVRINASGLYSL